MFDSTKFNIQHGLSSLPCVFFIMGWMDFWILVFQSPCLTGLSEQLQTLWEWDGLETTGFALSRGEDSRNKVFELSARRRRTRLWIKQKATENMKLKADNPHEALARQSVQAVSVVTSIWLITLSALSNDQWIIGQWLITTGGGTESQGEIAMARSYQNLVVSVENNGNETARVSGHVAKLVFIPTKLTLQGKLYTANGETST